MAVFPCRVHPPTVSSQADAGKLEAENAELRKEVMRLKQQLILEEIRNGGIEFVFPYSS